MALKQIYKTARSVSFLIEGQGPYFTEKTYDVYLNGEKKCKTEKVVTNIFGLFPETDYKLEVKDGDNLIGEMSFKTDYEFVTLNVRDFGAKGDGVTDDTKFIQAAILACPKDSRVLIPAGSYKVTSIFLKSDLRLEIAAGAELLAITDRTQYPILPGLIESWDEKSEYNLGSWEGNPLPMFSGIICGINAENVILYGEGVVNGCASKETWWKNPKVMNIAFRPRLLFINSCDNFTLQGLTLKNSPAWTIHPYFSNNLRFIGTSVENPADSPNTDGLDPESCKDVEICGVRFSLGDDCIAVKSGKIYMGAKYKKRALNTHIYQCLMENGHGAVTLGSEMAGGVEDFLVEDCLFRRTDRGLRVKTRRGRGEFAVLDKITFRNIVMDNVMTPFTANAFYFCDPDGHTPYVQSREALPVDEATPRLKKFTFENIDAKNCHVAALYFAGLPELPIEEIEMRNVYVNFADECKEAVPIMSEGVEACTKRGVHVENVKKLVLDNVKIEGAEGEATEMINVESVEES